MSPLPEEDGQNPQDIAKTKGTLYEWKEVEHAFCQKSIILINLKKDDVCLQYHMASSLFIYYLYNMVAMTSCMINILSNVYIG